MMAMATAASRRTGARALCTKQLEFGGGGLEAGLKGGEISSSCVSHLAAATAATAAAGGITTSFRTGRWSSQSQSAASAASGMTSTGFAAAGLMVGGFVATLNQTPIQAEASSSSHRNVPIGRNEVADAAEAVAPAVVNLAVLARTGGGLFGVGGGHDRKGVVAATGSGFIIDTKGVCVTNAHVVRGAASTKLRVTLHDGRTVEGQVVAADAASDIAVVQLDEKRAPYPCVKLGQSDNLRAGEWVVALGSPLHLSNTVTVGIISNVTRRASDLGMGGAARARMAYLQTDAAINQGNSGGPLCDLDGRVVGVNTMKALGADGVSFAIPIDEARRVVTQLLDHGRVRRPYLGMKLLELNAGICESLRTSTGTPFPPKECERGAVLLPHVHPGAPADRCGLHSGDVIVKVNEKDVTGVQSVLDPLEPGKKVHFEVVRRDETTRKGFVRLCVVVQAEEMRGG